MVGSLVEGWGEQRAGSVSFELISPQPTKTNMCRTSTETDRKFVGSRPCQWRVVWAGFGHHQT